ncbi:MAG TPA: hypothetical protein PLZ95_06280, partial [Bryobacteraceae bacterium]|nr:hypothetical protein [Bryobacteraceae bacterium]
ADLTSAGTAQTLTGALRRHADAAVLLVFTDRPDTWETPLQQLAEYLGHIAEIGAVLGMSEGAARVKVHRARARLEEMRSGTWKK